MDRLLTNVDEFESSEPFCGGYASFFSGTKATFSAGIIAVGENIAACMWVEDED